MPTYGIDRELAYAICFFILAAFGIEFGGDSGSAECLYGFERGHGFVFSEVEENNLHARAYAFGEKVEAEQHVVDSVGAKRYAQRPTRREGRTRR